MPRLIIDASEFQKGLHTDRVGLSTSKSTPSGFYVRSNGIDLHRQGFEGHPMAAQTFSAGSVSNAAINSLPRAVAVDVASSPANVYYILAGLAGTAPRVVKVVDGAYSATVDTLTASSGNNFTTLPSTGAWGEDVILYKVGSTYFLFYSWNDSGKWDVGRATAAGTSPQGSWMSTFPAGSTAFMTGTFPRRMVEAPNGKLYITNGQFNSEFDGATGANGTFDIDKYDLGVGWIATDIRKYGSYLATASVRGGSTFSNYTFVSESRMTLWNMTDPGVGTEYPIDDSFVSAIFPVGDKLYAFSTGRNNTLKIHSFTGNRFKVIWESFAFGGTVDPRSIDLYRGQVCFVPNTGGNMLTIDPETDAVNVEFLLNDGTNDTGEYGLVKNIDQGKLWFGGKFGSTYKTVYLTLGSTGAGSSKQLRTRNYVLSPYGASVSHIGLLFSSMASGGSAKFGFVLDNTTAPSSVGGSGDKLNLTVDFATYGAVAQYEKAVSIPNINSFYMIEELTGPVAVKAVVIDYEEDQ